MDMTQERSWVEAANDAQSDFPLQNLPYGVFRPDRGAEARIGVGIGGSVLDLHACVRAGLLSSLVAEVREACLAENLNELMGLGDGAWRVLRRHINGLLRAGSPDRATVARKIVPMSEATMLRPVEIGNYTDFYSSMQHAETVGRLFRPEHPLAANYKYVPIGYHGRASSIVVSGTAVKRPMGQWSAQGAETPEFGPSRMLDYEMEVGALIAGGNRLGHPIPIEEAEAHLFGICLVNDWSARDVQVWESQPLGPFLGKSFATTVSPWVVTMEALRPFRMAAGARAEGDPEPLPYLRGEADQQAGGFAIMLEAAVASRKMRESGMAAVHTGTSHMRELYWTFAQMIAHHTSNGCNLCTGDLIASGTVSGEGKEAKGCLLEMTQRGAEPFTLPTGEQRTYLEDGDEVILRGYCRREGARGIGLGECRGIVTV